MNKAIQSVNDRFITELLEKETFEIPLYQRFYDWDDENVEEYWDSLMRSEKEDNEVFFGQIVTAKKKTGDRLIIIDGQQRITTTCILLEIIRDLSNRWKTKNEETIQNTLKKLLDHKGQYVLTVTENNYNFYQDVVKNIKKKFDDKKKEYKKRFDVQSNKKIWSAYEYLYEQVVDYSCKPAEEGKERQPYESKLYTLLEVVEKAFTVIHIEVADYSTGSIIFTNLNTKGKNIESWHAIKNFFYLKFRKEKKSEDYIKNNLKEYDLYFDQDKKYFKGHNFLKHYVQSRYSNENMKFNITGNKIVQCFDKILNEKEMNEQKSAVVIFSDLINSIKEYKILSNAEHENKETNEYLKIIKQMGIISPLPLFLSAIKTFDEYNFRKLIFNVEAALFKYQYICNFLPQKITDIFCSYAPIIYKKKDNGEYTDEIKGKLKAILPTEEQFKDKFFSDDSWRNKNKKAQIVLLEIEKIKTKGITFGNTTLDHISPLSDKTDGVDEENKNKIGNMCLLSGKNNSEKHNKPFKDSKDILKRSGIGSTEKIGQKSNWDNNEIIKRTEELFISAQSRWA